MESLGLFTGYLTTKYALAHWENELNTPRNLETAPQIFNLKQSPLLGFSAPPPLFPFSQIDYQCILFVEISRLSRNVISVSINKIPPIIPHECLS